MLSQTSTNEWVTSKIHRKIFYLENGKVGNDRNIGKEIWRKDGKLHREDGPAKIWYWENGQIKQEEWYLDHQLHRKNGPAITRYQANGSITYEKWLLNGNLHQTDGPTITKYRDDGSKQYEVWYLDGVFIHEGESPTSPPENWKELVDLWTVKSIMET